MLLIQFFSSSFIIYLAYLHIGMKIQHLQKVRCLKEKGAGKLKKAIFKKGCPPLKKIWYVFRAHRYQKCVFVVKSMVYFPKAWMVGRPLKGRNIPGCSVVISWRLHFRVLSGINQFQNQFSRIWNRFKPEGSGFFEYFTLKTSLKSGFTDLKPVYTRKYSKM